jgi:hypothetical protein
MLVLISNSTRQPHLSCLGPRIAHPGRAGERQATSGRRYDDLPGGILEVDAMAGHVSDTSARLDLTIQHGNNACEHSPSKRFTS